MDNVKHIFKIEKGEPFYIANKEYYKIKLVSKDQDKKISFSHPYIFVYRLDDKGENLYIAGENNGKISKYNLQFHNNRDYTLKDFQGKMKLEELPSHFLNVKIIEHGSEHRFALYDKVVNSSTDTEEFIMVLPSSSLLFKSSVNVSEYKNEKLRLTLKDSYTDDYGKKYLPIIIKENDKSEICELRSHSLILDKDDIPYTFEPNENSYYWWDKHNYGNFRYVALIDNGDDNFRLQLSNEDGTELMHESTFHYNKFLNMAFHELNSSFLNQLGDLGLFLSGNQIQTLVNNLEGDKLKGLVNKLNHEKLEVIAQDLTDSNKIKIIIDSLSTNHEKLQAFAHNMSEEQFKELLDHLDTQKLKNIIHKLPYTKVLSVTGNQSKEVIKILGEHLEKQSKLISEIYEELKELITPPPLDSSSVIWEKYHGLELV